MGKHFGELAKIRGLITYKLSPHEQRAYAGAVSNGIPNMFRRFRESVFKVAPRKYLMIKIASLLSEYPQRRILIDEENIPQIIERILEVSQTYAIYDYYHGLVKFSRNFLDKYCLIVDILLYYKEQHCYMKHTRIE